jgi:hypothetical protein
MVYHGKRAWCTKDSHCTSGGTCNKTTGKCSTSFAPDTAWNPGHGDILANGAKFLDISNPNPFAARDAFRQHVIDSEALFRAIQLGAASGITGGTVKIDPAQVHYVTRSMGSIAGVPVVATTSLPKRVVLNVGGAPLLEVFENAPAWKTLWGQLLTAFNLKQGTLDYLKYTTIFAWIMDAVDPGSFGKHLALTPLDDLVKTGSKIPKKEVMCQLAGKDTYVPPVYGQYLAKAIGASLTNTTYPLCEHHFLRYADPAGTDGSTKAAQAQLVHFLKTGKICKPDTTAGTCN